MQDYLKGVEKFPTLASQSTEGANSFQTDPEAAPQACLLVAAP